MKTALEKKYKLNVDAITEKDIIYFCRDALSLNTKEEMKAIFEEEILELIKSKEWDWFSQDIDKNIILTYPIRNNAFTIVKYLIENNKYNFQEYNTSLSGALKACISLTGETMCEYLLSKNLHQDYLSDMTFQAYIMSDYVMPKDRSVYLDKAQQLVNTNTSFTNILNQYLTESEFTKVKLSFVKFLEDYPLSKEEKLTILKPIVELAKSGLNFFKEEKNRMLDNWVRYLELTTKLQPKNQLDKKTKI